MKRNCLILTALVIGCVLFLWTGCQKQVGMAGESKPELTSSKAAPAAFLRKQEAGAISRKMRAPETTPKTNEPAPKIMFEEVIHDFGEIGPRTKNVCEFKFTNMGDGLLKITKVTKTCGCTPFTLAKKEYAPGESGALKVKYHSGKRPGQATRRLFVYSNDKARPKVELTIKAKIARKVDYEPRRLSLSLKEENAGCPKITLTSLDGQPFSIKRFKSTADCITADVDSSVKATRFVIEAKVNMEKLRKYLNGRIDISLTHPQCGTVTIPFSTLSRFTANPPLINIRGAKPQKPIIREIWILNNYDEDFEIESVSSKEGIIKVLSQEKIDNHRYKFELEITPPAAKGEKRLFMDTLLVNIKDDEELKITCLGLYSRK